jgi:ABC-type amino acid transport substrate-binding protein
VSGDPAATPGLTKKPGILRVGAAFPDPPFEVPGEPPTGFDVDLMQAVAAELGLRLEVVPYRGDGFEGIFAGLDRGEYDAVASGTTITAHRRNLALFCRPYVRSGQSLVVDAQRRPGVGSIDDLAGLSLGVQRGNTSEPVAHRLQSKGKVGAVRTYAYHDILLALDDLEAGRVDAFMKLEPVMRSLIRERPSLRIVQTGITEEHLAVAVGLGNARLADAIDRAQSRLSARGVLAALGQRWFAAHGQSTEVLT